MTSSVPAAASTPARTVRHRFIEIDGLKIFVRQAGDPGRPTLVLLPGFPSDGRAYLRLIDRLADRWHLVTIDYPGFGLSDPLPDSPTFDRLAEVTAATVDALGIEEYALYLFDFGAPVGMRIALAHDQRVRGLISQNGNVYTDGFGPGAAPLAAWWQDRAAGEATIDGFVSLAGTQAQWAAGVREPEAVDPEDPLSDQRVLDLPGRADYMKALLWDYRNNPARFPAWQQWLRDRRPAVLAVWGRRDPFFVPAGAQAFRRDVPDAEIVLLDTGHFALQEELAAVADAVDAFLARSLTAGAV